MSSHDLDQRAWSLHLGVPPATVYNWESGNTRLPDATVADLSAALQIDADRCRHLLTRATPAPPPPVRSALAVLRLRRGISQVAASRALGVARSTLRQWEEGQPPPLDAVRRMAAVYAVSVARVADAAGVRFPTELDPTTWRAGDLPAVLRVLRAWSGLTQAELAARCGARPDTVRAWEAGRTRPTPESRRRLEHLYRLPPEALRRAW